MYGNKHPYPFYETMTNHCFFVPFSIYLSIEIKSINTQAYIATNSPDSDSKPIVGATTFPPTSIFLGLDFLACYNCVNEEVLL